VIDTQGVSCNSPAWPRFSGGDLWEQGTSPIDEGHHVHGSVGKSASGDGGKDVVDSLQGMSGDEDVDIGHGRGHATD